MPKGGPGQRKARPGQCKICGEPEHPGRVEIDAMLLNGAPYKAIIARMEAAHPGAEDLTEPNLSRHKNRHLLTKPIKTTEVDPETGEVKEAYIIGHLTEAPIVPKSAIPKPTEVTPLPDALGLIINCGLINIAKNPALVSPTILIMAIDMARKMGVGGKEVEEFAAAWSALNREKSKARAKRTTTVTVEETIDGAATGQTAKLACPTCGEPSQPGAKFCIACGASLGIIDAEVVAPAAWSEDDLKLLESPEGD